MPPTPATRRPPPLVRRLSPLEYSNEFASYQQPSTAANPDQRLAGYAYAPDQYVVIDQAELEPLRPAKERALSLERFVDHDEFNPALFSGRALYLMPDHASKNQPVSYVVFDLLAYHGRSLVGQPLQARRALLQDVLARWQEPRVLFSEGVVGPSRVFFEQTVRQALRKGSRPSYLASRYRPGKRRSMVGLKIKPASACRASLLSC